MIAIAGLLAGWTAPAVADEAADPRNRASFQVVVTREVENDWATARLSAMAEGQDPARVAADVNERIERALATAKKEKGVEVESGGYVTQPVYDENRIVRWQAWQEIRLESSDVDRLSKLIGQLQGAALTLSGIEFSVKRETREALQNDLTLEALRAFRARADLITKGMGRAAWSLVSMSVGQGGSAAPVPRHARRGGHGVHEGRRPRLRGRQERAPDHRRRDHRVRLRRSAKRRASG